MVECLNVAAGILARSEGVFKGTGADMRFVKNALKICVLPSVSYKYLFLSYFCHIKLKTIQTTTQCVCYMISVNNFCIYQLLRRSDLELISMNYQSHTHQIMVM